MSKPIVMLPGQWSRVLEEIKKREKPSVYLSRTKMKEVLGFTVRDHREYVKDPNYVSRPQDKDEWFYMEPGGWFEGKMPEHTVRLDFYNEQKRTMFLLKYGNGQI
jgi:hypothetical protein